MESGTGTDDSARQLDGEPIHLTNSAVRENATLTKSRISLVSLRQKAVKFIPINYNK